MRRQDLVRLRLTRLCQLTPMAQSRPVHYSYCSFLPCCGFLTALYGTSIVSRRTEYTYIHLLPPLSPCRHLPPSVTTDATILLHDIWLGRSDATAGVLTVSMLYTWHYHFSRTEMLALRTSIHSILDIASAQSTLPSGYFISILQCQNIVIIKKRLYDN